MGVIIRRSGGKWSQRTSYTEVTVRIPPCLVQIKYLIKIGHRMAFFPRWSNLKHFNNVTTTHFTDGQAFYDILKVRADLFWRVSKSLY